MSKGYEQIPGLRMKIRTTDDGWATATLWMDDEPVVEFGRLNLDAIDGPGCDEYQAWVESMSKVQAGLLRRVTGIDSIVGLRRKPDYKGEADHDS